MNRSFSLGSPPLRRISSESQKYRPVAIEDDRGNVVYQCEVCKKQFNKNYNLRAHFRLHTGERPFICKVIGCGKTFTWRSSLTSHRVSHGKDCAVSISPPNPPLNIAVEVEQSIMSNEGRRTQGEKRAHIDIITPQHTLPPIDPTWDTAPVGKENHMYASDPPIQFRSMSGGIQYYPSSFHFEQTTEPNYTPSPVQLSASQSHVAAGQGRLEQQQLKPTAFVTGRGRNKDSTGELPHCEDSLSVAMLELESIVQQPSLQSKFPGLPPVFSALTTAGERNLPWKGSSPANGRRSSPLVDVSLQSDTTTTFADGGLSPQFTHTRKIPVQPNATVNSAPRLSPSAGSMPSLCTDHNADLSTRNSSDSGHSISGVPYLNLNREAPVTGVVEFDALGTPNIMSFTPDPRLHSYSSSRFQNSAAQPLSKDTVTTIESIKTSELMPTLYESNAVRNRTELNGLISPVVRIQNTGSTAREGPKDSVDFEMSEVWIGHNLKAGLSQSVDGKNYQERPAAPLVLEAGQADLFPENSELMDESFVFSPVNLLSPVLFSPTLQKDFATTEWH